MKSGDIELKPFAVIAASMLLGACQFESSEQGSSEPQIVEIAQATTPTTEYGLKLPEGTECNENDAFFAKLMSEGYERVVTGYGGQVSPPYDIAVWRTYNDEAQHRLVLTISNVDRACKIIGMDEFSAPAG